MGDEAVYIVCGAECSGKSTLAAALAQHLGAELIGEFARAYVDRHQQILTQADVLPIAEGQFQQEQRALSLPHRPLVFDTNILNTRLYAEFYHQHCPAMLLAQCQAHARTGYYIWCAPDVPWQAQPLYRGNEEGRESMDQGIQLLLSSYDCRFIEVNGNLAQRLSQALAWIESLDT